MWTLYKKELRGFLSSLIGYLVITVFLLTIGLFLWVFPATDFNIPDNGFASIEGLFLLAPWVFLFLIPAVTMKMFSEEKKSGTIELLLTRPLSDFQILFAKFSAGLSLVCLALIPTLIYYLAVHLLANPVGNIDTGAMWGSYIGLLFLAAGYVSIGLFASSLTDSQIVSFILSLFLCFFLYIGFDSLSSLALFGKVDMLLQQIGMQAHYTSMSRGVLDTRDLVYFLSISGFFMLLTHLKIRSRTW
jgi:ABC-2 type transport system permease protein